MTATIYTLHKHTTLDVPVERVCDSAKERCKFVFIAGYDEKGEEYFACSSGGSGSIDEVLYLLERFKFKLMSGDFK
jgi:hypothetical protein